jgi:hypothetical protein
MSQDKNEYSDEEIKELLKEVLKTEYENRKNYNKKVKINTALASTVKEFLTNFVVLGYDLNDNPVIIKYARTQMEKDALKSLAVRYMSKLIYEDD